MASQTAISIQCHSVACRHVLAVVLSSVLLFVNVETSCALTDRLQPVLGVGWKALSAKLRKVVWI